VAETSKQRVRAKVGPNCQVSSKSVNRKWVNKGHRTDKQTDKPVSDLVHAPRCQTLEPPLCCGGLIHSMPATCAWLQCPCIRHMAPP